MEAVSPETAGPQVPVERTQCSETGFDNEPEKGHPGEGTTVGGACAPAVELDPGGSDDNGLGHDGGPAKPEEEEQEEVEEVTAKDLADEDLAPKVVRVPRVPTKRERERYMRHCTSHTRSGVSSVYAEEREISPIARKRHLTPRRMISKS